LCLSMPMMAIAEEAAPATEPAAEDIAVESPLMTLDDQVSYTIGVRLAGSLQDPEMPIDLNASLVAQAVEDVLSDRPLRMTDQQMDEAMGQLGKLVQQTMDEAGARQAEQAEEFLMANAAKEGVVTTDSGLQYEVLEAGSGAKPTAGDTVTVHYRGTLVDGTEFDSSYKRGEPAVFGVSQVISGWTEALQLMPTGSKWRLVIPPALGYGERSVGRTIPANAVLVFEVELLGIEQATTP